MAKGGNNQRSNGSRFSKPYDTSNSFVKKVALRVSDYLGGWFGTPMKSTGDSARNEGPPSSAGGDTPTTTSSFSHRRLDALDSLRESTTLTRQCFNDVDVAESPAKRLKMESKGKYEMDFPISPIPSTSSGLFQTNINHNFNIKSSEDYLNSGAGPSGLQNQRYAASSTMVQSSTTSNDMKANGAADDHSESSESTSGCSSLVPQSDRLSQSAYVCSSRKKNLEDKLNYARQLKQSRASLYLNQSIPVGSDGSGCRRKPSFDISVYGSPMFDKSSVRDKMVNSPFYTGQTSYGGASAYKRSRSSSLYAQRNLSALDRREGLQLQVKPSHHGSTEDLSNMSHTAKRILEALEQFSTPINDAKRIPINAMNPPLGSKRRRFEELSESRVKLSTPKSPLNPNAGPSISGLNVPTVPDLLKLKRLERIQNSTAAARQVAVQNQEYSLPLPPVEVPATKHTGKIVTKLKDKDKDKDKDITKEKVEEVNLPKVSLPITTLPKFDITLPPTFAPPANKVTTWTEKNQTGFVKNFTFSPPIPISVPSGLESSPLKSNFTFSRPLNAESVEVSNDQGLNNGSDKIKPLADLMSSDALAKLKRKSNSDNNPKSSYELEPAKELKTGSVMDILKKAVESDKKVDSKSDSDTWECSNCLCRNLKGSKNCVGCLKPKINMTNSFSKSIFSSSSSTLNENKSSNVSQGFGDKFKPPSGSWTCKECFVTNSNPSSTKCVACESPKPSANVPQGFGDKFKPPSGSWTCKECFVTNSNPSSAKCIACESPKPSAGAPQGFGDKFKPPSGSWTCKECFVTNSNPSSTTCIACESPKPSANVPQGFGDKFKPPSGSWTCKECFVTNGDPSSTKCVACESPKPSANVPQGFGDKFKPPSGSWTCKECFVTNSNPSATSCIACEAPKPSANSSKDKTAAEANPLNVTCSLYTNASEMPKLGAKTEKPEPPKFNFGIPPGGGGFKFGIDKADLKANEVKPLANGPQASNPPAVATPFGTFTFGIPKPVEEKKEKDPSAALKEIPNTPKTEVSNPLFSSTPITSKPEASSWNNAAWAKQLAKEDNKEGKKVQDVFNVDSQNSQKPASETGSKTFFKFGSENKTDSSAKLTNSNPPESNPVKFSFKSNSASSVEVPSSTTGFTFGTVKPTQSSEAKPSSNFDFVGTKQKESPKFVAEVKEVTSAPSFGSATSFNDSSKIDLGKSANPVFGSAKSSNSVFGSSTFSNPAVVTAVSSHFQSSASTFSTSSFNGSTSVPAFGAPVPATATTTAEITPAFGSGAIPSFGNNQGLFGSNSSAAPAFPNPTTAPSSGFGGFGASSLTFGNPTLNSNPTPAPSAAPAPATSATPVFGTGFSSTANADKPAPFVFGANPATTTAATPAVPPPSEVFKFGASKPETKPFGSAFGQNGQQPFSFGAPATNNVFGGGFSAPKTESTFGTSTPAFGNNPPMNFGMNSAPPAFGSTTPSFSFNSNNSQPQPAQGFQFGANKNQPQSQPASAPATSFSLSVPSTFNFAGGQTPSFSADPNSAPPMPQRRLIKAVRRTQR